MGIFDKNKNLSYRFPSFYNSTWHKYSIPSVSWQATQPVFNISSGNIDTPNIVANAQNGVNWNPFGWKTISMTGYNPNTGLYGDPSIVTSPREILPTNLSYFAPPTPYRPFEYNQNNYNYDDIYSDEDPNKKPVSKQTIENVRMGLNGATQAIDALGQGRTTGAGEKDANYFINAASKIGSNLPGEAGLLFSGINAASSLLNALAGSELNENNIKAFESAIQNRARWQMGDNSTTSALVGSSANNVDLKVPGVKYFGKNPLLSDILGYGVGKASAKAWSMKQPTAQANAQAHNTEALGYKDYQNKYIRNGLLAGSYALGGSINRFDNGGGINTPRTHGSLFNTGLTEINAGGRHSENQFGGVQFGVDQYGIPNLVEEGETVFNAQSYGGPQDYAFSDEIEFPIKEYGHLFSLGGITKRKKGKYKKYTFADVSKYLAEDIKQNPNSEIVKRTFAENAGKLANIQEEVKAKDMINQMNPMDIMMALQQSPMGEQMVSDTQGSMDQQAMMGQEPMVAACGGKLHGLGGNLFAGGGGMEDVLNGILGISTTPFNITDYTRELFDPKVYRTRRRSNGGGGGNNRPASQEGKNNTAGERGEDVRTLPESLKLYEDLFGDAVDRMVGSYKDRFDKAVKGKDYAKAEQLAHDLQQKIYNINMAYVVTAQNPSQDNIKWLQEVFNDPDLGLNDFVNEFLNDKTKGEKGDNYPVWTTKKDKHGRPVMKNGKPVKVPYLKDNALDNAWGVVTQNRLIQLSNQAKEGLEFMGMTPMSYWDWQNRQSDQWKSQYPEYLLENSTPDYLKQVVMPILNSVTTTKVVPNPNYVEGGDAPEYIPIEEDVLRYAPKDTKDAKKWWDNLTDEDKQKYLSKYSTVGDPTRTGVYTYQQLYNITEAAKKAEQEANKATETTAAANNDKNKLLVPKPRKDWETMGSLGVALSDYIKSQFNIGMGEKNPGAEAAYNYLSRVGMIPMVRNHMVGTKHEYHPTDRNYRENIENNITRGDMRMLPNLNYGNSLTNFFALMNQANKKRAEAQVLADETDRKERGFIYGNNNEVDKANAQGSLNAQTVNAQNLARAREAQATAAIQLSNILSGNNKTWLDYQNQQSSGLADLMYKLGYNKLMFNARDAGWLLNNQQEDSAKVAGVQYNVIDDYTNYLRNKRI